LYTKGELKNGSKKAPVPKKQYDTSFVECRLTKQDEEALNAHEATEAVVFAWFSSKVFEGYKISISQDKRSGCVAGYMSHSDPLHENAGMTLSARAADVVKLLICLMYKHEVKLDGVWGTYDTTADSNGLWG